VEQVSWDEAQEFIRRLNSQTGKNYRLPYEAEWEYAARSGGKLERWAGTSNTKELSSYAWTKDENDRITHPVGTKKPNGLGLFDMTGNVWEWCKDWYDEDFYKKSPENNPHGPLTGSAPVIRGGSWNDDAARVRATSRSSCDPDIHVSLIGFRVVLPVGK
jgi:formylglycine-generating enzyme required for sulfatase activity